jgi:arylsulfatase A-like enzyme
VVSVSLRALALVARVGFPVLAALGFVVALALPHGAWCTERTSGDASKPDVILVLLDTWRFDHLGINTGRAELTPNLDALANESIRFTRAISPSNVTSYAMPGVMSSFSPGITLGRLPEELDSLSELLRRAGYATLGVSANPNVSRAFGYGQGFDAFLDPTDQPAFLITSLLQLVGESLPGPAYAAGIVDAGLYYRPFSEVRRRGTWLLERSPGPTFLYLHTMDLHGPYLPPKAYLPSDFVLADFYPYHRFNDLSGRGILGAPSFARHLRNLKQRYEAGARYSDAEFGRLIQELRAAGRWDESLVWVLSDHGEGFGEHDHAGHGGENVTTTLIQVPLLLKLPRSWRIPARVESTPVSTLDLLPTTLGLLGLTPPGQGFGRDWSHLVRGASPPESRTLVSYASTYRSSDGAVTQIYSAIGWPWKLDLRMPRNGEIIRSLFHLEEDPREDVDLAARRPEIVARLEREVSLWRERELGILLGSEPAPIDPRVQEQLRSLGYAE